MAVPTATVSSSPGEHHSPAIEHVVKPVHLDDCSATCSTSFPGGMSIYAQFQKLRTDVEQLNQQGVELFRAGRFQAALFHFNEAFRLVTSTGSHLLDEKNIFDGRETKGPSLFGLKPSAPEDFMQPLVIVDRGIPRSMADIEIWVLIASMKLMINGALGHFGTGRLENAEQLLQLAIALSEDDEDEDDDENFEFLRRKYYSSMVLMSVHFILGQVLGKPTEHEMKLSETRMRDCMESLTQALTLAEDLLESTHLVTAKVYVSIGQVLLREGYMQGASFAFQSADRIYNKPRISESGGFDETNSEGTTSAYEHMSDIEVSTLLLGAQGFSFGAPMA